jgi:hypothetical protein
VEDLRAIELQVVRHVAHATNERQAHEQVERAVAEYLEERVVDEHGLLSHTR